MGQSTSSAIREIRESKGRVCGGWGGFVEGQFFTVGLLSTCHDLESSEKRVSMEGFPGWSVRNCFDC